MGLFNYFAAFALLGAWYLGIPYCLTKLFTSSEEEFDDKFVGIIFIWMFVSTAIGVPFILS